MDNGKCLDGFRIKYQLLNWPVSLATIIFEKSVRGQGSKSNKYASFIKWKFLKVSFAIQELIYIVFCALLARNIA